MKIKEELCSVNGSSSMRPTKSVMEFGELRALASSEKNNNTREGKKKKKKKNLRDLFEGTSLKRLHQTLKGLQIG